MGRFPLRLVQVLTAGTLVVAGCGTPASMNPTARELDSLTLSPATAAANGSAVQFTATGHWSQSPATVTPQSANWGACTTSGVPTSEVTVSATGLAACASGATGSYSVFAWDPQYGSAGPVCTAITACGPGCGRVAATAQLTCP